MGWQLPIVVMIVAAAVTYLARRTWRSLTGRKAGGCGGCGCARAPSVAEGQRTLIPADQITLRLRKGEGSSSSCGSEGGLP
jgi:hypothetical protein